MSYTQVITFTKSGTTWESANEANLALKADLNIITPSATFVSARSNAEASIISEDFSLNAGGDGLVVTRMWSSKADHDNFQTALSSERSALEASLASAGWTES